METALVVKRIKTVYLLLFAAVISPGGFGDMTPFFHLYPALAHRRPTFTADMTTYYCPNMEEALRRAKKAGREAGCYFGGITLRFGRRGFAIYREGKVVEQYTFIGR